MHPCVPTAWLGGTGGSVVQGLPEPCHKSTKPGWQVKVIAAKPNTLVHPWTVMMGGKNRLPKLASDFHTHSMPLCVPTHTNKQM